MEDLIQKDIQKREKMIKTLECDELFFLQAKRDDIEESIEVEIEIKGCFTYEEV